MLTRRFNFYNTILYIGRVVETCVLVGNCNLSQKTTKSNTVVETCVLVGNYNIGDITMIFSDVVETCVLVGNYNGISP